jgi:hypothetical protein
MDRIGKAVLLLSAFGFVLTLCEQALPRSGVRRASKAALGLLFLELLAEQIAGILR